MKASKWKNYPLIITNTNTAAEKIHTSNVKNIFLKIVWHKQAKGHLQKWRTDFPRSSQAQTLDLGA